MKLFRKIFIQVMLGILLVSQATLVYTLLESRRQTVEDTEKYETQVFNNCLREFNSSAGNLSNISDYTEKTEDRKYLAAIYAFRQSFGSRAALYLPSENRELFNSSPYELDYEKVSEQLEKWGFYPIETEGRHILVMKAWITIGGVNYGVVYCVNVSDVYQRTEDLYLKGLAMTFGLLLAVGALLYWGIYRSIRPLVELKNAASEIAGGHYGVLVQVQGKDEIAELGKSFNYMSAEIQARIKELEQVNQAQLRLIGSLAHELKTPMTAIIGYADTLLTVRLSEERREKALTYIGKECRRLSRLSVKMLELTGLYQEGGQKIDKKTTSVEELLKNVEGLTRFKLQEKNITLETSCEPSDLAWSMDEDMMTSLLLNLVDNAFKASGEGGQILIHADETGIFVEDKGKGIPKEELERVTEAFYMVDKSRARSAGSVGLGLALCKEIAQLHGGRLVLESAEGIGTRVSVLWNKKNGSV